jgi:chromosome partitioning protein
MITIAIANNKGGTGKTTTAVTLATGLAGRGHRVLLVDTDAQGHVALYLGLPPADDVFRLLIAELPIADCIAYANGHNRLAVVRSGEKTTVAKTVLGAQRAPVDVLARCLDPLRGEVDFCLVDAAPSVDPLGLATLYVADYVLVPAKCETLSLDGIRRISSTILDLHQTYKAATRLLGVLPTMYRKQTREHRHNLREMAEAPGDGGLQARAGKDVERCPRVSSAYTSISIRTSPAPSPVHLPAMGRLAGTAWYVSMSAFPPT